MTIKTVSQLPEFKSEEKIADNTYFGVSYPIPNTTNRYMSQRLGFKKIMDEIDNNISSKYSLKPDFNNDISNTVSSIISGDFTFYGNKHFNDGLIYLSGNVNDDERGDKSVLSTQVPNKGYVDNKINYAIQNQPSFIRSTSQTDAWLEPHDGNGKGEVFVHENGGMFGLYLNQGNVTNEVELTSSGNLVIYGYVAAPKNIQTSQCWIALEGLLNNEWKMLQLQPWIVGSKSSFYQYVGFNAPVAEGLKIRIVTGFQPNLNSTGYGNTGLIFALESENENIQVMNTFYGYIIH